MFDNQWIKILNANTPNKPTSETTASMIDHDRNVCPMVVLKYSLNIQNPVSFTLEKKILPAPVASVKSSRLTPELSAMGAIKPAAVKAATVAEPSMTRRVAVMPHAKISGETGI